NVRLSWRPKLTARFSNGVAGGATTKGRLSRPSRAASRAVNPRRVLSNRMLPTSYKSRAGTCTSTRRRSISSRSCLASFNSSSSRVLNHLMRTEVSTTIFAPIAVIAIITDDVSRIPLTHPALLQLSQGSHRLLPRSVVAALPDHAPQCLADQPTSRSPLRPCSPVYLLEKLAGERNHHLRHWGLTSRPIITRGQERGNNSYITRPTGRVAKTSV